MLSRCRSPNRVEVRLLHIAVIPARMGSEGFPFKNRQFFDVTADFIETLEWLERVIVSTDDPEVDAMARLRGFETQTRPEALAGPAVPIKHVFENLVEAMAISDNDILWLFYLPVLHKAREDFEKARRIIEPGEVRSLCSFVPAKTHPYSCWRYDQATQRLSQYVENNVFRRQDLPPAWQHYHYTYCCFAGELPKLNDELLNAQTYPLFLTAEKAENLIEVDTPEDFERWELFQAQKALR